MHGQIIAQDDRCWKLLVEMFTERMGPLYEILLPKEDSMQHQSTQSVNDSRLNQSIPLTQDDGIKLETH